MTLRIVPLYEREMDSDPSAPDLLSEVLARVRVRTTALGIGEYSAPWGYSVPKLGASLLYLVTAGEALIRMDGLPAHHMRRGDIVLVSGAPPHSLSSDETAATPPFNTLVPPGTELWAPGRPMLGPTLTTAGGGGGATRLLSALIEFVEDDNYLLRLNLPPFIAVSRSEADDGAWQRMAIEAIAGEAMRNQQGYLALAMRLGELLCVDVIRSHLIGSRSGIPQWLSAADDARLARVLHAMHSRPERHWTVGDLALEAGMSRSSFTQHFSDRIGEPPLSYLTRWRMTVARDWIIEGRMSIKQMSDQMGYRSDKAFSQAFRRTFGHPPSYFRSARGGLRPSLPPK